MSLKSVFQLQGHSQLIHIYSPKLKTNTISFINLFLRPGEEVQK